MNDKVLIISIFSLLGIGFVAVLFVAVPWLINYALPDWKNTLLDSGIVMVAIVLFVYGFYMNTRMH
jgi:apolipoprotein N-acyltransferase